MKTKWHPHFTLEIFLLLWQLSSEKFALEIRDNFCSTACSGLYCSCILYQEKKSLIQLIPPQFLRKMRWPSTVLLAFYVDVQWDRHRIFIPDVRCSWGKKIAWLAQRTSVSATNRSLVTKPHRGTRNAQDIVYYSKVAKTLLLCFHTCNNLYYLWDIGTLLE